MLTRSLRFPVFCCALFVSSACDKEESLGDVDSDSAGETAASDTGAACPADAMECPDGTVVGRSGPECTFDPCPGESGTTGVDCPSDAMECPDGTVVGRSGPDCAFDPCPGETDSSGDDDSSSGGDDVVCPPNSTYQEAASCPTKEGAPFLIDPGCYQDCDPGAPTCDDGSTCLVVETNPCICEGGTDCCAACAVDTALCVPVSTGDACEDVVGTTFESVEELDCGIAPDGKVLCNWTLSFSPDGSFNWAFSDAGVGGGYVCKDGLIVLDNSPGFSATYDPETGILSWDDVDYVAMR